MAQPTSATSFRRRSSVQWTAAMASYIYRMDTLLVAVVLQSVGSSTVFLSFLLSPSMAPTVASPSRVGLRILAVFTGTIQCAGTDDDGGRKENEGIQKMGRGDGRKQRIRSAGREDLGLCILRERYSNDCATEQRT